jgi:hypothetical protein
VSGGLSSQPRLLKGAFVDSNVLAFPPLIVPFQFNPEQIRRRRSARIATPPSRRGREEERQPRVEGLGEAQTTTTPPETMSLDVRLDATDELEAGDPIAAEFGVLPTLSALELMVLPRSESFFGGLLGLSADLGFGDRSSTPVVIFVWGRQRVQAVRITDLDVQEVEYNPNLSPSRVVASVSLQVIGGENAFNRFTQAQQELLAGVGARTAGALARTVLPL